VAQSSTRPKPILRGAALLFMLAASLVSGGCQGPAKTKANSEPKISPGGVLLRGAGATLPYLLYKNWFAAYQQKHPDTVIVYDAVGSGEGVRRFMNVAVSPEEQVDFGASDTAMTDEQMAHVSEGALLLPMTASSVAIAYNLPNFSGELKLSRTALSGIFNNEIKNWDDPRIARINAGVKLPKLTITLVVRQDSGGTTFAFTKHLDALSPAWRRQSGPATLVNWQGNAIRAKGNEGIAGVIQNAQGSIGYVGYEFARQLGLKMALIENKEGMFVSPSSGSASVALASVDLPENLRVFIPDPIGRESYPIVTLTWILAYKHYQDARKAAAIMDLFSWCLSEGQQYAPKFGYAPLPTNIASKSLAALRSMQPK